MRLPQAGEAVSRQSFTFQLDNEKLQKAEFRDGHYLLSSNLLGENPAVLWGLYLQLTQIEAAFKTLKSELGLRPIYHQVEKRVEAGTFVAFQAYAISVTLKRRLMSLAPGLTPRAALEKLATIQMLDVLLAHDRRTLADNAPLHAAGTGAVPAAAPAPLGIAGTAVASHQGRPGDHAGPAGAIENVVPT